MFTTSLPINSQPTRPMVDVALLYRLLLVQTTYEKKEKFDGVAGILNSHPLLRDSGTEPISDERAREIYHDLLKEYNIEAEGENTKTHVPMRCEILAQRLYQQYSQQLLDDLENEKPEFAEAYKAVEKYI